MPRRFARENFTSGRRRRPISSSLLYKVPIFANRILRAEDKSDRVCSSCGRKMKTLHQLYSLASSALFSSENRESESEE